MDAADEAPEKTALVRNLVPDGAGIPVESLEGGSDGGRQRSDLIWPPLEEESSWQEHGCFNHPALPKKGKEVLADRASTGVRASSNSENISHVFDVAQDSSASDTLDLDIEIGNHVDNAPEATATSEGGNDGETHRINHISLVPLEVQSFEQQPADHPNGNSNRPHPPKGKELLVGAVAGAGVGDKSESVIHIFEGQDSSDGNLNLDIEKGKIVYNVDAIGGKDVETGPRYPHQLDNDDDSVCRICHLNSAAGEIVNLGCACKLDLGQAHKRCANTWFAFRGKLECEICGELTQNFKTPDLMTAQGNLDDLPDTVIVNIRYGAIARWLCIRLVVICLVWVAVIFLLYKFLVPALKKASYKGTAH